MRGCAVWFVIILLLGLASLVLSPAFIIVVVGFILLMLTLLRWFEQATEAVEQRWWSKTMLLVIFPFSVWFFPNRVIAGRPTAAPRHEPVRGFGSLPKTPADDLPPPGTPAEFIGIPKNAGQKAKPVGVDEDKIEKMRRKMREQGLIKDDET